MAKLWYGHFDSTEDDLRELTSEQWARYISSFITDGIHNGGSCLQVTAKGGTMAVSVAEGMANIKGYIMRIDEDLEGNFYSVVVPPSDPSLPRYDRLVIRLNTEIEHRTIMPLISMGVASEAPEPPPLRRDESVWDLSLAKIYIPAGAVVIEDGNITDERFETELCGVINSALGLDPSSWQGQFDSFMDSVRAKSENDRDILRAEWDAWFATLNVEIQIYATFNFSNLAALPWVSLPPPVEDGDIITETMFITGTETKVAEIVTDMSMDGLIIETETLYKDGSEVIRKTRIITDINTGETRTEAVL